MNDYVILTDAAADHAETFLKRYSLFEIIPMEVMVNGKQYVYGGKCGGSRQGYQCNPRNHYR